MKMPHTRTIIKESQFADYYRKWETGIKTLMLEVQQGNRQLKRV